MNSNLSPESHEGLSIEGVSTLRVEFAEGIQNKVDRGFITRKTESAVASVVRGDFSKRP